jgi:hypothetical protein
MGLVNVLWQTEIPWNEMGDISDALQDLYMYAYPVLTVCYALIREQLVCLEKSTSLFESGSVMITPTAYFLRATSRSYRF